MTSFPTALLATVLLATIAGCSREESPPPPATTAKPAKPAAMPAAAPAVKDAYAELMRAIFGAGYRAGKGNALADMPDPDKAGSRLDMVLTGQSSTRLSSGETVLAVNGEMADANGNADSSHAAPGILSIYVLDQQDGQWRVLRRHESIASLGSFGQLGELRWVVPAKDKVALAVLDGGTWQGQTISLLSLFDVTTDKVRDLTGESIAVYSTNEGACGPTTDECWEAKAAWSFAPAATPAAYDDLVLTFSGARRTIRHPDAKPDDDADDVERNEVHLAGKARYAFDGERYRLVEGGNIVPGI